MCVLVGGGGGIFGPYIFFWFVFWVSTLTILLVLHKKNYLKKIIERGCGGGVIIIRNGMTEKRPYVLWWCVVFACFVIRPDV